MTSSLLLNLNDFEQRCTGQALFDHTYPGTPFSVQGFRDSHDQPGHWSTTLIVIFRHGQRLGAYHRLYGSHGQQTFAPFEWQGVWYALYSANYTCTRVLRLNHDGIEDWCGEEPSGQGFCPGEYHLPQMYLDQDGPRSYPVLEDSGTPRAVFEQEALESQASLQYPGFGFLAGCHWGDDSDWKLRYVDYSHVQHRAITIDERFGYHPLPNNLHLAQCVDVSNWEPECPTIMTHKREFHRISTWPVDVDGAPRIAP